MTTDHHSPPLDDEDAARSMAARQALQAERDRMNDALGHDSTCRRRQPPDSRSRGIDPDNCARCRYLQGLLDKAHADHEARGFAPADRGARLRTERVVADKADRQGFVPGETVEVNAFGHWYTGQVVKATVKTVTVRYTSGTGTTRDKTVPNPTRPDMAGKVLVRHPGGA